MVSASSHSPGSTDSRHQAEPWWMDAQLFLPVCLGPLAFLITVFPALESLTHGGGVNLQSLFMKALIRLILFSVIGYAAGSLLRWVLMLLESNKGGAVDITVEDPPTSKRKALEQTTISVPVATEHLEPGMKLAKPVVTLDGKQLIASGVLLTKDLIEMGKLNGIETWKIEGLQYVDSKLVEESMEELESPVE